MAWNAMFNILCQDVDASNLSLFGGLNYDDSGFNTIRKTVMFRNPVVLVKSWLYGASEEALRLLKPTSHQLWYVVGMVPVMVL